MMLIQAPRQSIEARRGASRRLPPHPSTHRHDGCSSTRSTTVPAATRALAPAALVRLVALGGGTATTTSRPSRDVPPVHHDGHDWLGTGVTSTRCPAAFDTHPPEPCVNWPPPSPYLSEITSLVFDHTYLVRAIVLSAERVRGQLTRDYCRHVCVVQTRRRQLPHCRGLEGRVDE